MKQTLLLTAIAAMVLSASAAVPFEKGKTPRLPRKHAALSEPSRAAETRILLDEDFSKLTDGTEAAPAPNEIDVDGYHIPDTYTAQPGWTGRGIHSAGGCAALYPYEAVNPYYPDEVETRLGYISTPQFMLNGTATLTFRAKAFNAEGASLWVVICDDDYGPGYDELEIDLTNEWKTYTLVATNGSLETPSYFQIATEAGIPMIDDIRLEFKNDRIATPNVLPAINKSATEFIASWEEVPDAKCYRLNVLCKEIAANPVTGEVLQTFDGLNINADGKTINQTDPGYPDGWTFDLSTHGSQDVSTDAADLNSAPVAIKFDAVGDVIESETLPYPLDDLSFWVKASQDTDNNDEMSLLRVDLFHSTTETWENIAHIPYYFLSDPSGCVYQFAKEALGDDVTKVKIQLIQHGKVDFYVDDLRLHYAEQGKVSNIIKDKDIQETEYTVSNINPANEYSYYVQAVNDDIVSASSYVVWVDGIVGLSVETEEPTSVTPTSFTASWKPLGHATDYKISGSRVLSPVVDVADAVVIEESFDNITEGTVSTPGTDWISPFDFGSKGWAATSWGATQPAWANGMAGTTGTNLWLGIAGLVYTPVLDLSCYDGKGIKVEATVVTTTEQFDYNGQPEGEGMYVIILRSPSDTNPIASGYMDTPVLGPNTGTMNINNVPADADLSQVIIAFMNKSGKTFFVDHAKITMNVPAGKTLITPFSTINTKETSYRFEDLDQSVDHAFYVTASTSRNFEDYVSEPSETRIVKTSTSGVENVTANASAIEVSAAPGLILISADNSMPFAVYNTSGMTIATGSGSATIPAAPGLYLVATPGQTHKLIVK